MNTPLPVPAVCFNEGCGRPFLAQLAVFAARVKLTGCATRCTFCGSSASLMDGEYVWMGTNCLRYTTSPESEVTFLERVVRFTQERFNKSFEPQEFKKDAEKQIPELQKLWDLIPQKRSEAYAVLGIIITILVFIITQLRTTPAKTSEPPSIIVVPSLIHDAFPPSQTIAVPDLLSPSIFPETTPHQRPQK